MQTATSQQGTFPSKVEQLTERLARVSWIWHTGFFLAFFPLTLYLSSRYPLWYDEIYTVLISRLPTVPDIWSALAAGADLHPPTTFLATRIAEAVFGSKEWALRLPSTLGVLVLGLCVITFLGRRMNPLWGFIGAMFTVLTAIFPHAFEARPYGMYLGLVGVALVSWQSIALGRHRTTALLALFASLALSLCCHYYGVLLFFPIALGEVVRNWVNRRIDWPVWASILLALPAILPFLPLLRHSLSAVANEKTTQVQLSVLWTSYRLLGSAQVTLAMVALLVIALVWHYVPRSARRLALPPHEAAAILGLFVLPLPAMAVALTVTHNLTWRYVLPLDIGAAILFVIAAYRLTNGSTTAALILAAVLTGIFGTHTMSRARSESLEGAGQVMTDPHYPDLPIVIGSGLGFVPAWYYAAPDLRNRLLFIADAGRALRYRNNDQSNMSIPYEARFFHWPVQTFDQFRQAHRRFLLNWHDEDSWLLYAYRDLGAQVEILRKAGGDDYLLLVTDPAQ